MSAVVEKVGAAFVTHALLMDCDMLRMEKGGSLVRDGSFTQRDECGFVDSQEGAMGQGRSKVLWQRMRVLCCGGKVWDCVM